MTNAQSVLVHCSVESSDPRQMLVILRDMQDDDKVYTNVAPNRKTSEAHPSCYLGGALVFQASTTIVQYSSKFHNKQAE
jgi:hypothetical protein